MSSPQGIRRFLADTRPLQSVPFRRLWLANIITVIGGQLTVVAVPAQIFAITKSSAYVGLTGLFGLVPLIVFGLYGGALADHFNRRTLLIVTTVGLIATSGLFFVQAQLALNNVWVLLIIFGAQQAFFALNQPVRAAILPAILDKSLLPSAQALSMTVLSFGAIAGPLLGGVLIPVLGFPLLYLADTLGLLVTLTAVVALPSVPVSSKTGAPGIRAVIEGIAYLRGRTVLIMSFVVDLIAMTFGSARALFPQIAHETFEGPSEGGIVFALLYASLPAGVLLGGLFSGWVSRVSRQGKAVTIAIALWGMCMAIFGLAVGMAPAMMLPMLVLALLAQVIGGAADMTSSAFRSSILLTEADDEVRGRLQGIFIVVVVGGPRLADVWHGAAATSWGTAWTAGIGGIAVVALLALATVTVPTFWRFKRAGFTEDA